MIAHRLACAAAALCFSTALAAEPASTAWSIIEDLTTEVGPRLAGSPQEAAARTWAVARLKSLGFANVREEVFTIPGWVRGAEVARLTAPYAHNLAITALGYSAPTPAGGIEGELVYFQTLDALEAAPEGSLKGKIAFVDHAMQRAQDGSGYGPFGQPRRVGTSLAAKKGAVAIVIRSAGTDQHRNPHTGVITWQQGVMPIPAGAVSNLDANLIARIAGRGKPMRLAMTLTGHTVGALPSGNVIGELPGRDPSLPPVLVGCHLDSWDLGTGALDDGAGCAIVTAAALTAQRSGQRLRTIRVLWAGSEEIGGAGGDAYAKAHPEPHALAMESDFGADRVWRVEFSLGESSKELGARIVRALAPMGIVRGSAKAGGGTDVAPVIAAQKLPAIDLNQDGTRYFDVHHTPDDTLDMIDPQQMAQNVEAWARVLEIIAEEPAPIAAP